MENTESRKKPKKLMPIIFGIILLIGAIWGVNKYIYAKHHEVTDDAQIESDISPVLSRITGYVNKINFEENQLVKEGDTLIVLDDRDLKIKAMQANAAYEMAIATTFVVNANIASTVTGLQAAKAGVESARVKIWKTTQDYEHYQNLIKEEAISKQKFEVAKADKENADADLKVALGQLSAEEAKIEVAKKQIAVNESNVAQKKADLDFANLQLSYSIIISPATGYVSRKNVQPGQLVNAGTPLFAIVSDENIYVVANFKETQLMKMEKGQPVEIKVDAFPDTILTGEINTFSAATGAKFSLLPPDNATGNFVKVVQRVPVKILIKTGKEMKAKLRPGMSVKVFVKIDL